MNNKNTPKIYGRSVFPGIIEICTENLRVCVEERESSWSVICEDLKLVGYSRESADDAIDDFKHSLDCFYRVHLDDGTLDDALVSFGWIRKKSNDIEAEKRGKYKELKSISHSTQLRA